MSGYFQEHTFLNKRWHFVSLFVAYKQIKTNCLFILYPFYSTLFERRLSTPTHKLRLRDQLILYYYYNMLYIVFTHV